MLTTEYEDQGIIVINGKLLIKCYEDEERVLVQHFDRISPEMRRQELHRVLVLGVYAADAVPASQTFRDVAEDADNARREMHRMVEEARKAAEDTFIQQSETMKRALTEELAKYVSPDRETSIPATVEAKVKQIVEATKAAMAEKLDAALNVLDENAPLAQILGKLSEVSTQMQVMMGRREERSSSAYSKGDDYQQATFEEIARIAEVHGDSAELSANFEGEAGTKAGDITVKLNTATTGGRDVRLVFEAMDREAKGNAKARLDSVLAELESAKKNRLARCAVAVASNPAIPATGGQRLHRPLPESFVVVYDKESWDPLALEVGYCLAKYAALRREDDTTTNADVVRAAQIIERLIAKMDQFAKLQSNLRDGQGSFLKAMGLAETLRSDLEAELTTLQALVSGSTGESQQSAA